MGGHTKDPQATGRDKCLVVILLEKHHVMCQKFSDRDEGERHSLGRVLSTRTGLGCMGGWGDRSALPSPLPHEIAPFFSRWTRSVQGAPLGSQWEAGGHAGDAALVGQVTLGTAGSPKA